MERKCMATRLGELGYRVLPSHLESASGLRLDGPLIVTLESDAQGRERMLMVDVVPTEPDDPIELLQFRLVYPVLVTEDDEVIAALLRALLLLNRALVIGHNGFVEENLGLYFAYTQTVSRTTGLDQAALEEIIGLIDYLTDWQGELLDLVVRGEADTDDVLATLARRGLEPQPLFFGRVAA